jgi:hypothetical protein
MNPRARRTLLEGVPCWAALVGRGGHRGVGRGVRACFVLGSRCVLRFAFFAGFKQDPPRFSGDPRGCPDNRVFDRGLLHLNVMVLAV